MTQVMCQRLEKKTASPVRESAEDVFGKMMAFELKEIPEHIRNQVKHEISKPVHKYQMQRQSAIPLAAFRTPVQSHVHNTLPSSPLRSFSISSANTTASLISKISTGWMVQ